MTDLRRAAEMALEALDYEAREEPEFIWIAEREALRQALAEPEPWVKTYCGGKPNYCATQVTTEVTTQVTTEVTRDVDAVNMSKECVDETDKREQEPWPSVQCVCGGAIYFKYTPPVSDYHERWEEGFQAAKREWVGLTEDEKQFFKAMGFSGIDIVEAKLKEKNT